MHLLEAQALITSSKVSKPYILEKYYPLPFDKYIVFAPYSKPAKNFSYFHDVLDILIPILKNAGITIVQIGGQNELPFPDCYHLQGKTSLNQAYSIIKNSLLYFGADTFASHFSSAANIPSVVLISNNHSRNVRGYWNQDKQIILEPDRIKRKPSFSLDEGINKQINEIKVESIASSVCRLLNIPFNYEYETLFVGESYQNKILEATPHGVTNISNLGTDQIVIRLDYEFNETILQQQMQHCPVTLVTDKPINLEILKAYKQRIKQIFYIITENNDPKFAMGVTRLGIPLHMFSYLPEEKLNPYKLSYIDISPIFHKVVKTKDQIKEISGVPVENLYYKSSKHILSQGLIFPSKAAYLKNLPNSTINQISPIIDNDIWTSEAEYMMIFRKKS